MDNIMIYAIDKHIYIQSNKMMRHVDVEIIAEDSKQRQFLHIIKSCYEKIHMKFNSKKYTIRISTNDQEFEKKIIL